MRYGFLFFIFLFCSQWLSAQMERGGELLYGNEWIHSDRQYFEISIAKDGIYRIQRSQLQAAGIPIDDIDAEEWQLWLNGQQVPLLAEANYIEFVGHKNRLALDSFLTENGKDDLLNHEYSLINDTAYYYLSWEEGSSDNARLRSIAPDIDNPPSPQDYFWTEETIVFTEGWTKPYTKISGANVYMSNFMLGEGFASALMRNYSSEMTLEQAYLQGPDGSLSLRFTGDYDPHEFTFTLNGEEVYRQSLPTFTMETLETVLDSATLSAPFQYELNGELNNRDRFHIAHIIARYPAQPYMPASGMINGFSEDPHPYYAINTSDDQPWYYYDLRHNIRYDFNHSSGQQQVLAEESPAAHDFIWSTAENIRTVDGLQKVEYRSWDGVLASDYIILTSERLQSDAPQNPVQQYADYRASEQGGEYSPAIVNVEDVYASFGYGIRRHPQSIRNFAHYIKEYNPNSPSVFIIGKGREYRFTRTAEELADPIHDSYFVPTYGYPSSDNLLFAATGEAAPMFPLGRLSIESKAGIEKYLDKVIAQERPVAVPTYENSYWKKRVVQLVGGGSLLPLFNSYLLQMAQTLEDKPWNPEIFKYTRESNQSIEKPISDVVFDHINEGISLVTYFGHSSTNSLGFDINIPSKYKNAPRYPFLIAMGCYGGNLNTSGKSVGEIYSSFEGGGFIGSIATSGLGEVTQLFLFARTLYEEFGENGHQDKVGTILLRTLKDRQGSDPRHSQQIMFYGDPALSLFQSKGPDYTFNQENISITPYPLDVGTDSFTIELEIANIGSFQADTIRVDFERRGENTTEVQSLTKFIPINNTSTKLSIKWPTGNEDFNGKNTLFATIDPLGEINELPSPAAKNNNEIRVGGDIGFNFFIISNGIDPGWPFKFSIVGNDSITLKGVTSDPLSESNTFLFEIDTISTFDSPFYKSSKINSAGGVLEWNPAINWEVEKVYYWRTAIQPTEDTDTVWKSSSFVYIPGREGWNQSHFGQFVQSDSIFLTTENDRLNLPKEALSITIKNLPKGGSETPFLLANGISVGTVNKTWNFVEEGIGIAVIDTIIFTLQKNSGNGLYNSVNDGRISDAFVFRTNTTTNRGYAINFIENIIPDNSDIFVYTIFDGEIQGDSLQMEEWAADTTILGTSLIEVLEERGAKVIKDVIQEPRKVYNFFYHQHPTHFEVLEEDFLFSTGDNITNTEVIGRKLPQGYFLTPDITLKNEEVVFSLQYKKLNPEDSIHIKGIQNSNTIFEFHQSDTISLDREEIGNGTPFRLFTQLFDPGLRSILDLYHIRFYQSEKIDLCWAPNKHLFIQDSLQIGESLRLESAITNLNIRPSSDTIAVRVSISKNSQVVLDSVYPAVWEDSIYLFKIEHPTAQLTSGKYTLSTIINPSRTLDEYNYQNNTLLHSFQISKDEVPPVLTTTFDGRIINIGDVVSKHPEIEVVLKDYNAKTGLDTTTLYYELEMPDGDLYKWSGNQVGTSSSHHHGYEGLYLNLQPKLEQFGDYRFAVKYSEDTSLDRVIAEYETYFKLVSGTEILDVRLYPNPVINNEEVYLQYNIQSSFHPAAVSIKFYDMHGRNVYKYEKTELNLSVGYKANNRITISSNLVPGYYIYEVNFLDSSGHPFMKDNEAFTHSGLLNIIK